MHAVGQPPMIGLNSDYMHYLAEAHIPYTRLHDAGGSFCDDCEIYFSQFFASCLHNIKNRFRRENRPYLTYRKTKQLPKM